MSAQRWIQIIGFLLLSWGMLGCVLLDDVEYDIPSTDTDSGNSSGIDYWDNGQCPGNVNTDNVAPQVSTDCNGVSLSGCCDANGNALYCFNGNLYCQSCASGSADVPRAACSWDADDQIYWCTEEDNGVDPTGAFLKACPSY